MSNGNPWFLEYCGDFSLKERDENTVLPMRIPLDAFPVKIGRTKENKEGMIYLSDKKAGLISRAHAEISSDPEQGKVLLMELGNVVNGTFINDRRLKAQVSSEIVIGDTLNFGIPNGSKVPVGGLATGVRRRPIQYRVKEQGPGLDQSVKRSPKRPISEISGGPDSEDGHKQIKDGSLKGDIEEMFTEVIIKIRRPEDKALGLNLDVGESKSHKSTVKVIDTIPEAIQEIKDHFQPGDWITSVNGFPVATPEDVATRLGAVQPGKYIEFSRKRVVMTGKANPPTEKEKSPEGTQDQPKPTTSEDQKATEPVAASASDSSNKVNLTEVEEELSCQICFEYLAYAAMLKCGHSFCWCCLNDWIEAKTTRNRIKKSPRCPSCNEIIEKSQIRRNIAIDKLVDIVIAKLQSQDSGVKDDWDSRRNRGRELVAKEKAESQAKAEEDDSSEDELITSRRSMNATRNFRQRQQENDTSSSSEASFSEASLSDDY